MKKKRYDDDMNTLAKREEKKHIINPTNFNSSQKKIIVI